MIIWSSKLIVAMFLLFLIFHISSLSFSKLGLDLVPRVGPFSVDPKDVGIVSLHNTHLSSDETAKNTSVRHFNTNLSHFIIAC
jgi:hypothetical protein